MISTETSFVPGIIHGDKILLENILQQYHAVENITKDASVEYTNGTSITHDVELILCHEVKTMNVYDARWMIPTLSQFVPGIIYGNSSLIEDIFNRYHVIEDKTTYDTLIEYISDTPITHDTNLILCQEMKTVNEIDGRWMVITGSELIPGVIYGNITLLKDILRKYHAIEDTRETTNELVEYIEFTNITHDTEVILCHEVKTSNILDAKWMILTTSEMRNGIIYGNETLLDKIFYKYHVNESGEEISTLINVTHDMNLTLFHIIHSQGELNGTWYVDSDQMNLTEAVKGLSQFFKSDSYVIGDRNTSSIIEEDIRVLRDMYLVVMDPTSVEIQLKTDQMSFNSSEVANDICKNLGICENIIVHAVKNDDNNIVMVIVMVDDELVANDLVDSMNLAAEACNVNSSSSLIDSSSSSSSTSSSSSSDASMS